MFLSRGHSFDVDHSRKAEYERSPKNRKPARLLVRSLKLVLLLARKQYVIFCYIERKL